MMRSREARREDAMGADLPAPIADQQRAPDAEEEALLADSVGLALLVVLDTLAPAERLAFVLHDLFGVAFDDIAPIVGRSEEAARQLASRARRRVRGADATEAEVGRKQEQRAVVDAFLTAVRKNDFAALLSILDPEVVLRGDAQAMRGQGALELRGAKVVAERSMRGGARLARPALIAGEVGIVVAPKGKLMLALRFTIAGGRVAQIEAIADPARLAQLELSVVD
jgi:RNA polymerase sigma-70 factor (ECF subfamily)